MMSLDQTKRPNVEELMSHPKISHNIKEQSMKDYIMSMKKKEEELIKKEK
jgi:hypothetical protein